MQAPWPSKLHKQVHTPDTGTVKNSMYGTLHFQEKSDNYTGKSQRSVRQWWCVFQNYWFKNSNHVKYANALNLKKHSCKDARKVWCYQHFRVILVDLFHLVQIERKLHRAFRKHADTHRSIGHSCSQSGKTTCKLHCFKSNHMTAKSRAYHKQQTPKCCNCFCLRNIKKGNNVIKVRKECHDI